jgi:membrane associated rhomboid family serine protease
MPVETEYICVNLSQSLMLEDREYMRQPAYREPRISLTVVLLIVNAAIFLAQMLVSQMFLRGAEIEVNYFALSLTGLKSGYLWQLVTFQFMHAGWLHLIFNSLAIFFFGRPVETALGRGRVLAVYFSSGIIGGVVQMLFALMFQSFDAPVVGASAGAYGLVAAFAVIHWTEQFTLFIYFFPVTLRGKTLLWGTIALAVTMLLGTIVLTMIGREDHSGGVANAAHLGGILTGFFYVRQIVQGRWPRWEFLRHRQAPRELAAAGKGKYKFRSSAVAKDEPFSPQEFMENEVDPILEKISAQGLQSLTAREREILETARRKISRP